MKTNTKQLFDSFILIGDEIIGMKKFIGNKIHPFISFIL